MKKVTSFLRVDQRPDEILFAINDKQHLGSCQWLTESQTFQEWVDDQGTDWGDTELLENPPDHPQPKVLLLNGRPGTGKTVAAGHVVRYLQSCNLDCSFYFFRHNDIGGSKVAALLRSLAFQMAESNFEVRRAVVCMAEDDVRLNHDDHRMLWTNLFAEKILKMEFSRPQYWVIDAIDECAAKGLPALIAMLSDRKIPVRVLLTSRPGGHMTRMLSVGRTEYSEITTGEEGTLRDIELLANAVFPSNGDGKDGPSLAANILAKCNGIFLWAALTVAKLEDAYSVEDRQDVLRQTPPEMDMFYSRIVSSIAESPSSGLARCILKWTICSPQPLHTEELFEAVNLDIGRTLTASAGQLETMTGHLVFVDDRSRVHITHQTAAEFLTQRREDFWIDRVAAHSRLSEICLEVLCGTGFAPPRNRRRTAISGNTALSPLSDYAAAHFSYHLVHSSGPADAPLALLNKFLRSNVLTWIERMANTGNVWLLELTARRFKTYLGRREDYQPPTGVEAQTVLAWAVDIHHIFADFQSSLLGLPSSIYSLVPPLCPSKSMIRQLFGKPTRQLRLVGPVDEDWSDRLERHVFPVQACAIACCARFLAVGLVDGSVKIYHIAGSGTFGLVGTLIHGRRPRRLTFNRSSSVLASCSARRLAVWDINAPRGSSFPCLWSRDLDFTPSHMSFHPDGNSIVLSDPENSAIVTFQAGDGRRGEPVLLHASLDSDSSDESDNQEASWTRSERITLDPSRQLAALTYRNASVSIWDLDSIDKIGDFEKEGSEGVYVSPPALATVFNPIPEQELLAIAYGDGDIVTCNPWTLDQTNMISLHVTLVALATTSDGRMLAGVADDGEVYLFLFETLKPVYRTGRPEDQLQILGIAFSADDRRFFDIRGQCCTAWEPFALLPNDDMSDDNPLGHQGDKGIDLEAPASLVRGLRWGRAITAIEHASHDKLVIVGRQDGTVDICERSTGEIMASLHLHGPFSEIMHLDWSDEKKLLLSVDTSGRCVVTKLASVKKGTEVQTSCLLDHEERAPICQAMIGPGERSLFIRTELEVKVLGLDGGLLGEERRFTGSWWMRHPSNDSYVMVIHGDTLHVFEWPSLKKISPSDGIHLLTAEIPTPVEGSPWVGGPGSNYISRCMAQSDDRGSHILAIHTSSVTEDTKDVHIQVLQTKSLDVHALLGCLRSRLFFLDASGWVCSITLKDLSDSTHYVRHFFIPPTWRSVDSTVIRIIDKTAVAFGRGEELMVFHGFLEFEERVEL